MARSFFHGHHIPSDKTNITNCSHSFWHFSQCNKKSIVSTQDTNILILKWTTITDSALQRHLYTFNIRQVCIFCLWCLFRLELNYLHLRYHLILWKITAIWINSKTIVKLQRHIVYTVLFPLWLGPICIIKPTDHYHVCHIKFLPNSN